MPPAQKSLIEKFLAITLLLGVVFAILHVIVPADAETPFRNDIIFVAAGSILVYVLYFRGAILAADFKGDGKYYFPHLYFTGACFTPVWFIYLAHFFSRPSDDPGYTEFFIVTGVFWAVYGLMMFVCWTMVKNGNEDWKMEDD